MKKILFILILISLYTFTASAQTANDDEDFQSWNDLQLTVPMSEKVDFYTQITGRFDDNSSRFGDGRYALGFVLKPTKSLAVTPFYLYVKARNSSGRFRVETG